MSKIKEAADQLFKQVSEDYLGKKIAFDEHVSACAAKLKMKVGDVFIGNFVGLETYQDDSKDFTLVIFDDGGVLRSIAGHKILSTFTKDFNVPRGTLCRIVRVDDLYLDKNPADFSDMKDYTISFEVGAVIVPRKIRKMESPPEEKE